MTRNGKIDIHQLRWPTIVIHFHTHTHTLVHSNTHSYYRARVRSEEKGDLGKFNTKHDNRHILHHHHIDVCVLLRRKAFLRTTTTSKEIHFRLTRLCVCVYIDKDVHIRTYANSVGICVGESARNTRGDKTNN